MKSIAYQIHRKTVECQKEETLNFLTQRLETGGISERIVKKIKEASLVVAESYDCILAQIEKVKKSVENNDGE